MIVCHDRKFVFIKTRKTGGTSLEMVLSRACGDGDVITPLIDDDERARIEMGFRPAQNHLVPWSELPLRRRLAAAASGRRPEKYVEHSRAAYVRRKLGAPIWRDYYTFAVMRHPLDRFVSMYYWKHRKDHSSEDIEKFAIEHAWNIVENWMMITDKHEIMVDKVIRYETMAADLAEVGARIGVGDALVTGMAEVRMKSAQRPAKAEDRVALEGAARDLVLRLCRLEMAALGYDA